MNNIYLINKEGNYYLSTSIINGEMNLKEGKVLIYTKNG